MYPGIYQAGHHDTADGQNLQTGSLNTNEVGLIEPLSVIKPDRKKLEYLMLDDHPRLLAMKERACVLPLPVRQR